MSIIKKNPIQQELFCECGHSISEHDEDKQRACKECPCDNFWQEI